MEFSKNYFLGGAILLINKPINWTSFQVVNKVRWLIKSKFNLKKIKVGHAGTLDPLAEGLLIICTGKMTKKIFEFQRKIATCLPTTFKSAIKAMIGYTFIAIYD